MSIRRVVQRLIPARSCDREPFARAFVPGFLFRIPFHKTAGYGVARCGGVWTCTERNHADACPAFGMSSLAPDERARLRYSRGE
jgi:hypothetical protein